MAASPTRSDRIGGPGRRAVASLVLSLALTLPASARADALGMEVLNEPAPPVALGGGRSLADLHDHWVLLHFWAIWCKPCRAELPTLDRLATQEGGRLDVIAISIDDADTSAIGAYARDLDLSVPLVAAAEAKASDRYWGWGIPVTYLIDPAGRLVGRMLGPRDWNSPAVAAALHATIDRH